MGLGCLTGTFPTKNYPTFATTFRLFRLFLLKVIFLLTLNLKRQQRYNWLPNCSAGVIRLVIYACSWQVLGSRGQIYKITNPDTYLQDTCCLCNFLILFSNLPSFVFAWIISLNKVFKMSTFCCAYLTFYQYIFRSIVPGLVLVMFHVSMWGYLCPQSGPMSHDGVGWNNLLFRDH